MVALSEVRKIVQDYHKARPFVAVFIGGTQGIGEYTVLSLAQQYASGIPLRVYIVGRGRSKAEAVIAKCQKINPNASFEFVAAEDLTLIKDVDRVCSEIARIEGTKDKPRIDLLFQTQGQVLFGPRQETAEGLDRSMSLLYYSRIRFINNFLPLLEASISPHVVSVYAAGMESTLYKEDLSLRSPGHYSFIICRSHSVHFKTMSFERIARKHPKLTLVHVFPGLILGPAIHDTNYPLWFRAARTIALPFAKFFATDPEEAGVRMLYAGTNAFSSAEDGANSESTNGKTGAYAIGRLGDTFKLKTGYVELRNEGFEEVVWNHTMAAYEDITIKGRFDG